MKAVENSRSAAPRLHTHPQPSKLITHETIKDENTDTVGMDGTVGFLISSDSDGSLSFDGTCLYLSVCLCVLVAQRSPFAVRTELCSGWRSWSCPNSTRRAPINASST